MFNSKETSLKKPKETLTTKYFIMVLLKQIFCDTLIKNSFATYPKKKCIYYGDLIITVLELKATKVSLWNLRLNGTTLRRVTMKNLSHYNAVGVVFN